MTLGPGADIAAFQRQGRQAQSVKQRHMFGSSDMVVKPLTRSPGGWAHRTRASAHNRR